MDILLVTATKEEVELLTNCLQYRDHVYSINGHRLQVLVTGVGMVAAAYGLASALSSGMNCDFALNAGIAGSFDRDIELGTVVQVVSDRIDGMGAEDGHAFLPAAEIGLTDPGDAVLYPVGGWNNRVIDSLVQVSGMTVNTVHGEAGSIARALERNKAQVEAMEGAAFFYVCNRKQLPCAQVRAVSNYVEKRDKSKWRMDLALKNLSTVTLNILNNL